MPNLAMAHLHPGSNIKVDSHHFPISALVSTHLPQCGGLCTSSHITADDSERSHVFAIHVVVELEAIVSCWLLHVVPGAGQMAIAISAW